MYLPKTAGCLGFLAFFGIAEGLLKHLEKHIFHGQCVRAFVGEDIIPFDFFTICWHPISLCYLLIHCQVLYLWASYIKIYLPHVTWLLFLFFLGFVSNEPLKCTFSRVYYSGFIDKWFKWVACSTEPPINSHLFRPHHSPKFIHERECDRAELVAFRAITSWKGHRMSPQPSLCLIQAWNSLWSNVYMNQFISVDASPWSAIWA